MSLTSRVINAYDALTQTRTPVAKNSIQNEAARFLRYGNKSRPMYQDWSQVEMTDEDMYTGYSYAAIKKRANRASVLGKKFLYTEAAPKVMDAAKQKEEELKHPYLELIKKSKEFSQRKFWHDISTYLDLEGIYYLMAVRAVADNADGTKRIGAIQKFVMLNPYEVKRVIRESDGTVGGYIENHNGMYREIPKEMIIEIRLLNPFNNEEAYSMTDAAKESQFTMKQAGDYTRHSIKGNINAPGAITTDVELEDHIFDNFVSRIKNHDKGEPLYGNGAGAIKWESMQIDLDKASLDKINEIHRSTLFAVSGTSKTMMGIEESGTGREVSKTQRDDFTENAVMPQIEDIIDALNLDYRRWYPEWEQNEYEILLDNPLESDREAELKDIEIRERELEVRESLVAMGYEYDIASKYAHGDISLEELGEPTLEPELSVDEADAIAARELGMEEPQIDSEPEAGEEVPDLLSTVGQTNDQKEKATNAIKITKDFKIKFVSRQDNEKRLKDAIKRMKQKKKEQKEARKLIEDEKKKTKKLQKEIADEAKKAEKDKEKTEVTPKPENLPKEEESKNAVTVKSANQLAARDIPDLYDGIDIEMDKLGCIMMNTEKIPTLQYIREPDADLYYETNYDQSPVPAENESHVTLLFGLLQNGNLWKDKVDKLLSGWQLPSVTIREVSYFDLGDSYAVVGLVELTPELLEGHERLTLLPHINTFSEYHPHITLAYIKKEADLEKWIVPLNKKYSGQKVATLGINYGDTPEEQEDQNNSLDSLPEITDEEMLAAGYIQDDKGEWIKGPDYKETIPNEAKQAILSPVEPVKEHNCDDHAEQANNTLEKAKNALNDEVRNNVNLNEQNLYSAVARLEQDIANEIIIAFQNGDIENAEKLLEKATIRESKKELAITLAAFYTVLFPIYAHQLLDQRASDFDNQGIFTMSKEIEKYIKDSANDAADSHVNTVIKDFTRAANKTLDDVTEAELVKLVQQGVAAQEEAILAKLPKNPNTEDITRAVKRGKFDDNAIYKKARDLAREGAGRDEIARAIRKEYQQISKNRAITIARHETNRVFNMAQFQADLQFLKESGLMANAYKVLRNRGNDPCPICAEVIAESRAHPVPFQKNFIDLGETITAQYTKENGKRAVQKLNVDYEAITAGNVHVNCRCEYELWIMQSDGTFLNNVDVRTEEGKSYFLDKADNGGKGSGHWGHGGRPGLIGGSGGGDSNIDLAKVGAYNGFDLSKKSDRLDGVTSDEIVEATGQTKKEYYRTNKGLEGKIYEVKPQTYLDLLIRDGAYNSVEQIKGRTSMKNVTKYAKAMKEGARFPVPELNYDRNGMIEGQEGIHRTLAAMEAGFEVMPMGVTYPTRMVPINVALAGYKNVNGIAGVVLNAGGGNPYHDPMTGQFTSGAGGKGYTADQAGAHLAEHEKTGKNIKTFKQLKKYNEKVQRIYDAYHESAGISTDNAVRLMGDWTSGPYQAVKAFENEVGKKDKGIMKLDYELTQAYFKAKGVKEITLSRGVKGKQAQELLKVAGKSERINFKADNAASWTDAGEVSSRFAEGQAVIVRKVPVKNIISTHLTNPGLAKFGENEFIVSDPSGYKLTGKDIVNEDD